MIGVETQLGPVTMSLLYQVISTLHYGSYDEASSVGDSLELHNGKTFSTKDQDNDIAGYYAVQSTTKGHGGLTTVSFLILMVNTTIRVQWNGNKVYNGITGKVTTTP